MKIMRTCFPFYSTRIDKLELLDLFEKRNEKLLLKFWEFLRHEFAHETLSFYMSIQEFKTLCPRNHHAISQRALLIYEKYLEITSPKEVNIEMTIRFRLREQIRRLLSRSTPEDSAEIRELQQSIFQESEADAIIQLKQGSFSRFRDSLKKKRGTFATNMTLAELIIQPVDNHHAHFAFQ